MTARGSLSQAGLLTRLAAADPAASRAQRQVWLILLLDWVRHAPGTAAPAEPSAPVEHAPELPAVQRVRQLLAVLAHDDALASRVRATLATFWRDADLPALMADYGFTYQRSLTSELSTRLRERLVPATPDTDDLATLFPLLFEPLDPHWIDALDDGLLAALTGWVAPPDDVDWRAQAVLAIAMLASAMRAAAYAQALRRRMDPAWRHDDPFRTLPLEVEALRDALAEGRTDDALRTANLLRARLDHCRKATDSIVQHLEAHGVSVNVVYQMDQMHARAERIELLLALVLSPSPAREAMGLLGSLLRVLRERRGIRPLLARQYSLLARQVAERSAEVGEHYIARDDTAYRQMLQRAAGGGLVLAGTTLTKFALGTLGLSAFWAGFAAGTNYAVSFLLIMLLHWTVATKQPAMTAHALAAQLPRAGDPDLDRTLESFVDRVAALIRSQAAAVAGNLAVCAPVVMVAQGLGLWLAGSTPVSVEQARYVVSNLNLLGGTPLFAAFTGVVLFVGSLIAGWCENFFVVHRLDSALAWNPRIVARLGAERAQRWAAWWRANVSGVAANVSLGMMLGLVPVFATFVGLPLDVRHVTLSTGQLAAAGVTLGIEALTMPAFWWCVAAIPVIGLLNVGVSFACAFTVALRSRGLQVGERSRLRAALWRRVREAPLSFVVPPRPAP